MGKRSDFERIDKNFYRTIDPRAVAALLPHLEPETRFFEPCDGFGDLISPLENAGHRCIWASDNNVEEEFLKVAPAQVRSADAFSLQDQRVDIVSKYDAIITNPPWTRSILHPMIELFAKTKPTWLLFDSDWAFTKQSAPYMKEFCTDIVAVGRLIWTPGTKMSGKDNCSWYRFSLDKTEPTRFHGR